MSFITPSTRSASRSRVKRSALILATALFATTLALGGGLAASAAPPAPSATLSATTATANGEVTLTIAGFAATERLTINFDSTNVSTVHADNDGGYTGSLYVPTDTTTGIHTVSVVGTTTATQTASITIVPRPTASPATATVTASTFATTGVTASFAGFTVGDSVQVYHATTLWADYSGVPVTVGASGVVSYTLLASEFGSGTVWPGEYFLYARTVDGTIAAQLTTITVVADPAPAAPATPVKVRANFAG